MVKGITRQVVMVRLADSPHFEQAIFFLKDAPHVDRAQLLEEARRLAAQPTLRPVQPRSLRPLLWALCGAVPIALAWLCVALLHV